MLTGGARKAGCQTTHHDLSGRRECQPLGTCQLQRLAGRLVGSPESPPWLRDTNAVHRGATLNVLRHEWYSDFGAGARAHLEDLGSALVADAAEGDRVPTAGERV